MRERRAAIRVLLALAAALAVALGGCGGGATLADPPPCATPTPSPTPRGADTPNRQLTRYANALAAANGQLDTYLADFRARWPENRNYRDSQFRDDFVLFAGRAACAATALQGLSPPASAAAAVLERDRALDAALGEYLAALEEGRDAVQKRNTSRYRDWAGTMDAVSLKIDEALRPAGQ